MRTISLVPLLWSLVVTGCAHAPLSAADKLHVVDCRIAVEPQVCPGNHDCVEVIRAQLASVDPAARNRWLEDAGCPAQVIAGRDQVLATWRTEPKQPVSPPDVWTKVGQSLPSFGCVLQHMFMPLGPACR
jgi:hypothetical protein